MSDPELAAFRAELLQPFSKEETLEIRRFRRELLMKEEQRKLDNYFEAAKLSSMQTHELQKAAMLTSAEYGKILTKTVFLLNGGALVALLSFTSALFGKTDVGRVAMSFTSQSINAFSVYMLGLVLAAASSALAALNWQFIYRAFRDEGDLVKMLHAGDAAHGVTVTKRLADLGRFETHIRRSAILALCASLTSLCMFILGTTLALRAAGVWGA